MCRNRFGGIVISKRKKEESKSFLAGVGGIDAKIPNLKAMYLYQKDTARFCFPIEAVISHLWFVCYMCHSLPVSYISNAFCPEPRGLVFEDTSGPNPSHTQTHCTFESKCPQLSNETPLEVCGYLKTSSS